MQINNDEGIIEITIVIFFSLFAKKKKKKKKDGFFSNLWIFCHQIDIRVIFFFNYCNILNTGFYLQIK